MSSMTHKPVHLSHIEAAAMPLVFLTAYTALHDWGGFRNDDKNNQKVLILVCIRWCRSYCMSDCTSNE